MMTRFRTPRTWRWLLAVLLIPGAGAACVAATPGGTGGGPVGSAVTGPLLSGGVDMAGETATAGGEKGSGEETEAQDSGPVEEAASAGGFEGSGAKPGGGSLFGMEEGFVVSSNKPMGGGVPAPSHDVDEHLPVLDGSGSLCRSTEEDLLLTVDGFLVTVVSGDDGWVREDIPNTFTLRILSGSTGETLVDVPLETKTEKGIARPGHVHFSIGLSASQYPNSLYDLNLVLLDNHKLNTNSPGDDGSQVALMGLFKVLPKKTTSIKSCISIQDLYFKLSPTALSPVEAQPFGKKTN